MQLYIRNRTVKLVFNIDLQLIATAENSNIDYVKPGADEQDSNDVVGGEGLVANSFNANSQRSSLSITHQVVR